MKKLIKIVFFITLIIVIFVVGFMKFQSKNVVSNQINNSEEKDETNNKTESNENAVKKEDQVKKEPKIEYINLKVEEVYIPILMYHSISDSDATNNLMVPVQQFKEQMAWLKQEGFTPMLMDEVMNSLKSGKVPKKPVAITFDDGYADNYTDAYKVLINNDMKATFFIITDKTDIDSWYMNLSMLKEMASKGMGIENHTSKHMELSKLSRENKISIIKEAKEFLKEKVGVDSKFLCYPVGRYDEETIQVAKELGIEGAVTTEGGLANINNGELSLKRIRISPMGIESFKNIFKK